MANIMDYLDWRGDLSMAQSPFNEVDNLILSQLAYLNFEDIIPSIESVESISIREASDLYFAMYDEETIKRQGFLVRMTAPLLKKMAQSNRFARTRLAKYVNVIDNDEQKQFSAVHFTLEDGTLYVAYRGTDNTIVGWKENFNMTYTTPVPAQLESVRYLEETVGEKRIKLRVGGHSKGGNLAVYAAVRCSSSIKSNIIEVYNNDGPGFDRKMIESKEYQEMLGRIKTIVPQSSVVGMLLEHEEEYIVVKSSQNGFMQHDAMSWEVLGNQFVHVGHITKESQLLDKTLKAWINQMDHTQREQFVDAMFYVFDVTDVKTLDDLSHDKWKKMSEIVKAFSHMSPENRKVLISTLKLFLNIGNRVIKESNLTLKEIRRRREKNRDK